MIRRLVSLVLASLFIANPAAMAGVSDSDAQEKALKLVDQYLAMRAEQKKQNPFDSMGRTAFLAQSVASQLLALQPEDFNIFVFHFADRYIHHPEEREGLFEFVNILHDMIKDDLANTARLNGGAADDVARGAYTYGIWVLLGGSLAWIAIMKSPLRTFTMIQKWQELDSALMRSGRLVRYGYKTVTKVVLPASAGGVFAYFLHNMAANSTHRLDPVEILNIVQANLACQLSYDTLQAEQQLQKLTDDDSLMATQGKPLQTQVDSLIDQVGTLQDQFPWLTGLRVNDPVFQKIMSGYPQAKDWQDYKSRLSVSGGSEGGECVQISLTHVGNQLKEMKSALDELIPAPAQGQPANPADLLKAKP